LLERFEVDLVICLSVIALRSGRWVDAYCCSAPDVHRIRPPSPIST